MVGIFSNNYEHIFVLMVQWSVNSFTCSDMDKNNDDNVSYFYF